MATKAKAKKAAARKQAIDAGRGPSTFWVLPEKVSIELDPNEPLYNKRVHLPLSEELMASLHANGNIVPIRLWKDGDQLWVVSGRQRVRNACEVNRRRAAGVEGFTDKGTAPMKLLAMPARGEQTELIVEMLEEDALRQDDPPSIVADKIRRALKHGVTEEAVAKALGCTVETVRNRLKLMDAHKAILAAVDDGTIGEVQARDITKLPREEQEKALGEMVAQGATRGAKARKLIHDKTKGKGNHGETGQRNLTRVELDKWAKELEDVDAHVHPNVRLVQQAIMMVKGDREAMGGKFKTYRPRFLFAAEEGKAE